MYSYQNHTLTVHGVLWSMTARPAMLNPCCVQSYTTVHVVLWSMTARPAMLNPCCVQFSDPYTDTTCSIMEYDCQTSYDQNKCPCVQSYTTVHVVLWSMTARPAMLNPCCVQLSDPCTDSTCSNMEYDCQTSYAESMLCTLIRPIH